MPAQSNEEHVSLEIGGAAFHVASLVGEEGLSRFFRFEIVCASTHDGPTAKSLIGASAVITLRDGLGAERHVKGIVAEAARRVHDVDSATLRVVVRPAVYVLSLGRNSRVFQDSTVVDIAKKVLGGSKAPTRWETKQDYDVHVYCAQYREDDWTFINRMFEEEGIYSWFDHEGGESTLVLADTSAGAPDLAGGALIAFSYETGMRARSELIEELGNVASAAPTKFSVSSFDPGHPKLAVGGSVGGGALEVYDAPGGGAESPAKCAARAKLLHGAANAAKAGIAGVSSSVRLVPGRVVEIVGHPVARLCGRYLVTEVSYEIQQRGGNPGADERPYACSFKGIEQGVAYVPETKTPLAQQAGLQTGVVVGTPGQEVYPDGAGRVRVQLHWDREGARDDKSGKWMRVAQRGTADSMLLPRIGWNVLTFNDEGTVDAPTVLSRIHDGEHPPAYPLPANKTRVVYKTATTPGGGSFNELYFEDKKGHEEMFMNASRDMTVLIQHIKSDVVDRDSTRIVGSNHTMHIATDRLDRILRDQSVTISGHETIQIGNNRTKLVTGNETSVIGGKRSISVADAHTTKVLKTRKLDVGAAMIDVSLGNIGVNAQRFMTVLVGGAIAKISAASINEDVGGVGVYTVGGAKVEITKKQRVIDVKDHCYETVGGAMILKSEDSFIDTADKTAKWKVGGLLQADAPDVLIEAKDKIEIKCGISLITILPDSVEISALNFDLSKAPSLVTITKKVEHNL